MTLLIVDDDSSIRFALSEIFKTSFDIIYQVDDGKNALDIVKEYEVDICILDYQLPDSNGIEILKKIKTENNKIEIILITAYGSEKIAIDAIKNGCYDFVAKPFENEELINRVNNLISSIKKDKEILSSHYGSFLSKKMTDILEKIKSVAKLDVPVLITGESGTGKEIIAKNCHLFSNRTGNFIAINCSTLPESLVESELFGAEKGAFTGAQKTKIGLFELANNGTLFLDEIGEMPFEIQAKLLRVLQENEINRIGGGLPIKINTRIIAATNRNLLEEIRNNKFREDLYYRLNLIKIEIPPLRERKEEILPLSTLFLNELNKKYKKCITGFSEMFISYINNNEWKGNIRELRNFIEQKVIFCNENLLDYEYLDQNNLDLIMKAKYDISKDNKNINFNKYPANITEFKKIIIEDYEKSFLWYYLNKNEWNISKTGEEIGLSRQDLHKKINKYKLR